MVYKAKVNRQENVGTIGVLCLGCGLDIGEHDYLTIQAPLGVYLLHRYCGTLLSEGIDGELKKGLLPVIPEDDDWPGPLLVVILAIVLLILGYYLIGVPRWAVYALSVVVIAVRWLWL